MSSLWTDLLFLHGHVTDLKLLRRLQEHPRPDPRPLARDRRAGDKRRLLWPFRYCLGIGDGQVRTQ